MLCVQVSIRIESLADPEDKYDVIDAEIEDNGLFSLSLGMNLDPGKQYRIMYRTKNNDEASWNTVAKFQTGHRTKTAMGIVLTFMLMFFALAGTLIIWKRYNQVLKNNQVHERFFCFCLHNLKKNPLYKVNPNRLLESGRITARSVLLISNVDNRHHIDIVLAFSRYLKTHCAVGEVYFALDPETGITAQADHDPWKWAQETSERISKEQNGFLVFIAGPPPDMGLGKYLEIFCRSSLIFVSLFSNLQGFAQ